MANLVATREALDRFNHELPIAGVVADRLRRHASTTRSMIDQCLSIERASTEWIDHNLAVIVADALEEETLRKNGQVLFNGIRRRFSEALAHDPEDLALALALSSGARAALDDERSSLDIALVAAALEKPQAGPRLIRSAVALVVAGAHSRNVPNEKALHAATPLLQAAIERLAGRLPHHPDHGLNHIQLAILAARAAEGTDRREKLEQAHAQAKDYVARFGETAEVQGALVTIVELLARVEGADTGLGEDAWELLNTSLRSENLQPKKAMRLLRTLNRIGTLTKDRAAGLIPRLEAYAGDRRKSWSEVFGVLLESSGNDAGLMTLWEKSLRDDPKNRSAAAGLAERLIANLRSRLKPPFDNITLGAVLDAVPTGAMARWSAGDINGVVDLTHEGFGPQRALGFLMERVLRVKEHKKKSSLWDRALTLGKEVGGDTFLEVARVAMDVGRHHGARLAVAEFLSKSDANLDEAQDVLAPLLDVKGGLGPKAQELQRKISNSPALRGSRRDALVAFEESVGIGTSKVFELRIAHMGQNYVLADIKDRPAPRFYDHKFLRVMIKASELPSTLSFGALKKGDIFKAPVRGQDSDPKKDKHPRLYWVADPSALTTDLTTQTLENRILEEEARFGVGTGDVVRIKVGWDSRRDTFTARVYGKKGKAEFAGRLDVKAENLPEGAEASALGRGKRAWGIVDVEESKKGRRYVVRGALSFDEPKASEKKEGDETSVSVEESLDESAQAVSENPTDVAERTAPAKSEPTVESSAEATEEDATDAAEGTAPAESEPTSEASAEATEEGATDAAEGTAPAESEPTSEASAEATEEEDAIS
jgi:hypothetical protein